MIRALSEVKGFDIWPSLEGNQFMHSFIVNVKVVQKLWSPFFCEHKRTLKIFYQ